MGPDVKELVERLDTAGVRYVLVGGMAATVQGSAIVTYDVDLCYDRKRENLKRLAGAFKGLDPTLRGAPKNLPFRLDERTLASGLNFTLETSIGDIDLLGEISGIGFFPEVEAVSEEVELFGKRVRVLTLEGLIRAKKAAGRRKDLLILPELEALLALRKKPS